MTNPNDTRTYDVHFSKRFVTGNLAGITVPDQRISGVSWDTAEAFLDDATEEVERVDMVTKARYLVVELVVE